MLLKKSFGAARESLLSSETEGKLGSVKNAIVIPLAGDIDGYMTGLAIEALTETPHQPKRPQIPSLSLLRTFAKAGAGPGDAVFYGAVRDLRRTEPKKEVRPGKRIRSTYDIHADIQLFLEDLKSGSILWSKTITLKESVSGERPMTADEVAEFRRAKIDAAPAAIKEDLIDNWKHYLAVAGGVIGVLVLILAIIIGIKAFVSYHDVR